MRVYLRRCWNALWGRTSVADHPALRFAPPGHFYSPIPALPGSLDQYGPIARETPGLRASIDLADDHQLKRLADLAPYIDRFDWPTEKQPDRRYYSDNPFFNRADATIAAALIEHTRPRRVVEVGSGFSSAIMLDVDQIRLGSTTQFTFIEPYPERLLALLSERDHARVQLFQQPVQNVDGALFDTLQANDVLFIDSSHVSKFGSDVNCLMFEILPRLASGVLIHIHDIFWPFEYPREWIAEGRAWTEAYLLRAFLQYNTQFRIELFTHYLSVVRRAEIQNLAPILSAAPGGSFWMRKL